jgi:hypothetical protein
MMMMAEMVGNYGWHLLDGHWLLGSRQPGEGRVNDPEAVVEKRDGVWCWQLIGEDAWRASSSFNEAMASANEAIWRKVKRQ